MTTSPTVLAFSIYTRYVHCSRHTKKGLAEKFKTSLCRLDILAQAIEAHLLFHKVHVYFVLSSQQRSSGHILSPELSRSIPASNEQTQA